MGIDKNWAINCLRHNKNCAYFGLASLAILNSDSVKSLEDCSVLLRDAEVVFFPDKHDHTGQHMVLELKELVSEFEHNPTKYLESLHEYLKFVRRNLLKESFEVTKAYANQMGIFPAFTNLPCYRFARIIRNCVSHDMHFDFSKKDLSDLPVSYSGVTIDGGMQGKSMSEGQLSPYIAFKIHFEFGEFVTSN